MPPRHRVLTRGTAAGALAATTVAVWFLIVDALSGHPFETPNFLAQVVLGLDAPSWAAVSVYTVLHYVVFALAGILVAFAADRIRVSPGLLVGLVVGFLFFDLMFYGSVAMTGVDVVSAIGWPAVLSGNLLAGLVLAWTLAVLGDTPGLSWLEQLSRHATIREGLIAGLIGAVAVAAWFLIIDVAAGRILFTPAALGSAVLLRARSLSAVEISAATVLSYTVLHLMAFLLVGLIASAIIAAAEQFSEVVLLGGVLLFVTFETFSIGILALVAAWLVDVLSWWSIGAANLIAALGMGVYLYRRHPALAHGLTHHNVEEDLARQP